MNPTATPIVGGLSVLGILRACFTLLAATGATLVASASSSATARAVAQLQFASSDDAAGWKQWSPRGEIAPRFSFEPKSGREGRGALTIAATRPSDFGAWRREITGLRGGQTYRFIAWYRADRVPDERRSVIARLHWLDAHGKPVKPAVRPPEYPLDVARESGWTKVESVFQSPDGITGLDVQLSLAFAAGGSVAWDSISILEEPALPNRIVRAMTIHYRARNLKTPAANVEKYCELIRAAAAQKPDIVCLPEGMTVVGTGKSYVDVAEPIPGPTTERLGALARELRTYIVAGIYERVAPAVYNTAVLIDREGKVAGRYRKTHLPREEWEAGLTPGDSYPVFETDFGKIGVLVCWDLQFPEPWRAVARQGAQVVLLPIWGGDERLLLARAIENHAFVISSSYDMKSCIVGPTGEILGEATNAAPAATAEMRLDQKIYQKWLGDMSTRTWKERRGDLSWDAGY